MKESDLNSILVSSINKVGWAYKIPDPPKAVTTMSNERPFDWFGVMARESFYVESKLLKSEFNAFPFSSIRPHQISSLLRIKEETPDANCLVAVGYWVSRRFYEVAFFDILLIEDRIKYGVKSFKKAEILRYREMGKFLTISKREIQADEIIGKIVYE